VQYAFKELPACDRLFVLSGIGMQSKDHTVLLQALRRIDRLSKTRIGALCSGSWVLALGGFLNGAKRLFTGNTTIVSWNNSPR